MKANKRIQSAKLFTELVLEAFRFNGLLIEAGDKLTRELGLTSSLWQVMGSIAENPLSMAQIARNMGLTRQGIRRSINILIEKGLVQFEENPDHKRAKLVVPTDEGLQVLDQLENIQVSWSNSVSKEFSVPELERVIKTIKDLGEKLN